MLGPPLNIFRAFCAAVARAAEDAAREDAAGMEWTPTALARLRAMEARAVRLGLIRRNRPLLVVVREEGEKR